MGGNSDGRRSVHPDVLIPCWRINLRSCLSNAFQSTRQRFSSFVSISPEMTAFSIVVLPAHIAAKLCQWRTSALFNLIRNQFVVSLNRHPEMSWEGQARLTDGRNCPTNALCRQGDSRWLILLQARWRGTDAAGCGVGSGQFNHATQRWRIPLSNPEERCAEYLWMLKSARAASADFSERLPPFQLDRRVMLT